ncbi:hypothetical protein [Synechococcus phage S-H25]|nr:hypothetical protein [Synechococcus phage S-H25]
MKSVSDTLTLIDVYIVYNQRDPQGSLFVWSYYERLCKLKTE